MTFMILLSVMYIIIGVGVGFILGALWIKYMILTTIDSGGTVHIAGRRLYVERAPSRKTLWSR